MKRCSKCSKILNWNSLKFKCRNCGKLFCSDCMVKVDIPSSLKSYLELADEFVKPEYSFRKLSYVYCPSCAENLINLKESFVT